MKHLLRFKTFLLMAIFSLLAGTSAWAADSWVKTAASSLATGDIVVIVEETASHAMSNANGTGSAPSATAVTLNSGKTEITSAVGAALQWVVTVNNGSYQFNIVGTENYLYCTNANNGVRVGANANNTFTISTEGYLVNSGTSRYIGVYNNSDWRCYTSINNNIKGQTFGFYKKTVSTSTLDPCDLALDGAPVALSFDLYNNSDAQVINYTTSSTGAVSIANNSFATFSVDQDNKTITVTPTAVTPSAQTITVNQAADDTYKAGSVTFTINVTNSNPAVNNISDITAAGTYKVRGTIVAKSQRGFIVGDGTGYVYYYNQNYTQADYNIGDMVELNGPVVAYGGVFEFNNTTTVSAATSSNFVAENPTVLSGADMDTRVASTTPTQLSSYVQYEGTLTVSGTYYNITSIDGANTAMGSISFPLNTDFTSLNGKKVKVTGYYVGISSSKYYNTLIGSIDEVVVTTPTLTVEPAVVNLPYTGGNGDFTVSPSNVDNAFGAYITYYDPANTENTVSEPEWLNVSYDYSNLSLSYSVTEENTTGAARTACFKYSVMCDNGPALSNMITVTQAAFVADYATLPFAFDGGRADIETTAGLTQEGLDSDHASSPKLKFNGTDDYVILKFNERPGTLTFVIKGNGFNGGTFTVQTSEDGVTYTDLKTYDDLGSNQSEEFNNLGEDVRYIKWVYTNKSEGNVALGNIALAKYSAPAPSITLPAGYQFEVNADGGDNELPVTCSNLAADPQLAVVFCDANGDAVADGTYNWITATYNATSGKIDGHIDVNTGDARTAYFKVSGKDANDNTVYSELITINQSAYNPSINIKTEGAIEFDATGGSKTLGVDYESLGSNPTFELQFFESDGTTETQCGWITYSFASNDNKVTITGLNNDEGAARTAYFKVYAEVNKTKVYSNLVTVNQAAPVVDYATLPFAFDGGRADIENTSGLTQEGLDSDYGSSPKLKFNGSDDAVILKINERPGTLTFDIKGNPSNNVWAGTFKVQTSEDGMTYTDFATYTDLTSTVQNESFDNLDENVRYIKWIYTEKSSGNVALGNITVAQYVAPVLTPSITITPATINAKANDDGGELTVSYENLAATPNLQIVFCDANGDAVANGTYDWISAEFNTNGNIVGTIQPNTGDARTAYLVVTGVDADNNVVKSNLVTINQAAPAAPSIVFNPESIDFDSKGGSKTIGGDYFSCKDFDSTPSLEILFFGSDGTTSATYDWLTVGFNNEGRIDIVYNDNTGAARSAYLKLHAEGTSVYSNLFTVNQAAYVNPNAEHYYQKVTADADLTDGQYLIVYEDGSVAFDGGLSTLDAASNTISVTIVGDKIEGNSTTDAATFTIDVTAGTLQSASGLYIGQTSDANGMKADASTAYQNTLSIDADGNADVVSSGGAYLRYNSSTGQERFRYFKSSTYTGQKAIQLYKRVEGAIPGYVATPTFDPAAGEVQAGTPVTISTTTAYATIRYTTDGSEPTTLHGEEYDKPIVINSAVTIKAIAVDDNWNVSAVAEATYTIATSTPTVDEPLIVCDNGTITITANAPTIVYTTDGTEPSYDPLNGTIYNGSFNITVNTTIKAIAVDNAGNESNVVTVEASAPVQPAQAGVVVWSEDWNSFDLNVSETPAANGDFTYAYTKGDNDTKLWSDALAGGTSPELLINRNGGAFTATIPLYGAYGNMTLTFKTNNKLSEVRAKVDDDTNNDITLDPETVNGKKVYTLPFTVAEGANQVVLTFTNNTGSNVRIDDFQLVAPQVAVSISSVGYSTMYYGSSNLAVPAGVTVSTYWVDGDLLKVSQEYKEGAVLAKAQGYVLSGTPGSYTFTATDDVANEDPKNALRGFDTAAQTTGGSTYFLLGVYNNKVGFYWGADNGAAFKSGSHKAYLAAPAGTGVRAFYFDDVYTGVDALNLNVENENAYDMQGRRVQQLQKGGLYILNGKKVLVK